MHAAVDVLIWAEEEEVTHSPHCAAAHLSSFPFARFDVGRKVGGAHRHKQNNGMCKGRGMGDGDSGAHLLLPPRYLLAMAVRKVHSVLT